MTENSRTTYFKLNDFNYEKNILPEFQKEIEELPYYGPILV
jgi:hypothetical protein